MQVVCVSVMCADGARSGHFQEVVFAIINDHNAVGEHAPEGNFQSFKRALPVIAEQAVRRSPL
jgi:hypothetical protein